MSNFVVVGRRLIPREQIAFVEPFGPNPKSSFQPSREFRGRVVMINRDSVLIEETPQDFAEESKFRMLADDRVATNPAIHFRVETFVAGEEFVPPKAYASRLLWGDQDGNEQSKLLLSLPEIVLSVAVRGETDAAPERTTKPRRGRRRGQTTKHQPAVA